MWTTGKRNRPTILDFANAGLEIVKRQVGRGIFKGVEIHNFNVVKADGVGKWFCYYSRDALHVAMWNASRVVVTEARPGGARTIPASTAHVILAIQWAKAENFISVKVRKS